MSIDLDPVTIGGLRVSGSHVDELARTVSPARARRELAAALGCAPGWLLASGRTVDQVADAVVDRHGAVVTHLLCRASARAREDVLVAAAFPSFGRRTANAQPSPRRGASRRRQRRDQRARLTLGTLALRAELALAAARRAVPPPPPRVHLQFMYPDDA